MTGILQDFFALRLFDANQSNQTGNLQAWYRKMKAYYLTNGLYDTQTSSDYYLGTWDEAMKPLRDAAHRSVEFYVSKLEPGALPQAMPIIGDNSLIIPAIQQIWLWSNMGSLKQVGIRWLAIYGDLFIKVAANSERDRVYMQFIEPEYITDFTEDERGNLQSVRIETPARAGGFSQLRTELWDSNGYRVYLHSMGNGQDESLMGEPVESEPLAALGIDFIPFTHAKFKDIGEARGLGCFVHALDKIDEANRMASRLHQMLFRYNKALFVARSNASDDMGRPLPPPALGTNASGILELEDDTIIGMPGTSTLESLVPDIRYGDALAILEAHMREIEKDLPELAYDRLREQGELSGRAVRLLLGGAIDRAKEARGNFETAMIKADKMALSIAQALRIFSGLGSYDAGDLDHSFTERDVIPVDEGERADTLKTLVDSGVPLAIAMRIANYPEEIISLVGGQESAGQQPPARPDQSMPLGAQESPGEALQSGEA